MRLLRRPPSLGRLRSPAARDEAANLVLAVSLRTRGRLVQQSFLYKILCSNHAFGAASKHNCPRTAYVNVPDKRWSPRVRPHWWDQLNRVFHGVLVRPYCLRRVFCVRGRLRTCQGLRRRAAQSLTKSDRIPPSATPPRAFTGLSYDSRLERIGAHPATHPKGNDWSGRLPLVVEAEPPWLSKRLCGGTDVALYRRCYANIATPRPQDYEPLDLDGAPLHLGVRFFFSNRFTQLSIRFPQRGRFS
jgi:hypothetical protein